MMIILSWTHLLFSKIVYSFTQIYDKDVKQKQLYDQIGFPLVQDCLNGKNGSVLEWPFCMAIVSLTPIQVLSIR